MRRGEPSKELETAMNPRSCCLSVCPLFLCCRLLFLPPPPPLRLWAPGPRPHDILGWKERLGGSRDVVVVVRLFYGCSTVVLIGFTCPAITVCCFFGGFFLMMFFIYCSFKFIYDLAGGCFFFFFFYNR